MDSGKHHRRAAKQGRGESRLDENMRPKFKALLQRLREKKHLVEFDRHPQISERTAGFVLDFSESLILLHLLDWNTFTHNGYVVIRERDINRLRVFDKRSYWQNKTIQKKKFRPTYPDICILSLHAAIESASRAFPLVTVEKETTVNDACWIGALTGCNDKTVTLEQVNTNAKWSGKVKFNLKDITTLAFGGGYESALALCAKRL